MVLAGVGDAMGYKWEFEFSGEEIHKEVIAKSKGRGVLGLKIALPGWIVSDDTVMMIATAEGLVAADSSDAEQPFPEATLSKYTLQTKKMLKLFSIARSYRICWNDMAGRAPGF